jgi:hypothetical protein
MPYSITRKKSCVQVQNKKSKRIASKCTTMKKAKRQIRLLNQIETKNQAKP